MKRTQRHAPGSLCFDKRRGRWQYFWYDGGRRRSRVIGSRSEYATKAAAWKAVESSHPQPQPKTTQAITVSALIDSWRKEKMAKRYSTRRVYESWIRNHVIPVWGARPITDVQARPVELWLHSLDLQPRSRASIRMILSLLLDYAMWRGDLPVFRNPMELVTIPGSSKRRHKARSLTVEEFQKLLAQLEEPFRTIALVSVSFGLRISECLALKWQDVDWLNARLHVQRSIVRDHVGDTKTEYSNRPLSMDPAMLDLFKLWKQTTRFSSPEDWVFASPTLTGRLPWSADAANDAYSKSAKAAGIEHVSTHSMRHTYRSWLDAVGTPIAVQQKLMRHADIRTTMNVYGDVVTDEMAKAHSKVVEMALNSTPAARKTG